MKIIQFHTPEAGRAAFENIMSKACYRNYVGQFPLPSHRRASVRRYQINGSARFILDSYGNPVCIWDVGNHWLLNAAKDKRSLKHVSAFYKWIEKHAPDDLSLKEIRI